MSSSPIDYDRVAEIYDLYVTASYDFAFFLAEVAKVRGPVLELTSGTGRLSLPLLEAGVRLTCVDVAQGMLDVLARKVKERGFDAELICADLCRLELPPAYELAILPFQSFMEIVGEERQRQALAAIFAALVPGGRFVCTMHNPAVRRKMVDGALRLVGRFPAPEGSLVVSGFEQGGFPVVQRLQFFEFFDHDGQLRSKRLLPMEFVFVEKDAFEKMAQDAGFRVAELFGNYDRSPFVDATSPVMIWVLQKGDAAAAAAPRVGATLALHAADGPNAEQGELQGTPAGRCRPGLSVPDLDGFHRRMVGNNVPCVQEPTDAFGERIARYLDPDGLEISVSQERRQG